MNSGRGMRGSDSVLSTECISGILLPIRCYTCNRVTGTVNTEKKYMEWIKLKNDCKKQKEVYLLQSLLKSTRLDSSEANSISRRTRGALKSRPNTEKMASIPRDPMPLLQFMGWKPARFCCGRTLISCISPEIMNGTTTNHQTYF